jgi:Cu+-exporting ATPase
LVPVYFEAAAVIVALVLLASSRAPCPREDRGAIRALLDLAPTTRSRLMRATDRDDPLAEVKVGEVLRVRPATSPHRRHGYRWPSAIDDIDADRRTDPVEKDMAIASPAVR